MKRLRYLLPTVIAGCSSTASYIYSPQGARLSSDGYPTTSIAVPPEAPQGTVDVTSFGITEITPEGPGPIAALHVRLAIANDGDGTPWTLNTNEQLVEIAGEGRSRPIFVNTDIQTLPTVLIAQRERRVLDFYYALPVGVHQEDNLPAFDVLWQVTTPARTFSSRTHFERITQQPPTGGVEVSYWTGWGPFWWYNPFYHHVVFVRHRPHYVPRGPRVIVTQPPRWHYHPVRRFRR